MKGLTASTKLRIASIAVILLAAVVYGTLQAGASSDKTVITAFLCGCSECIEVAHTIDQAQHEVKVYYSGSPGDADDFKSRNKLSFDIIADYNGSIKDDNGIGQCPAIIVASSHEKVILGNGIELDQEELKKKLGALK